MKHPLHLLLLLFLLLSFPLHACAHNLDMAASKWLIGKECMVSALELGPSLVAALKEGGEPGDRLYSCSERELQPLAAKVLQPYVNRKLALSVNGTVFPLAVEKVERKADGILKVWLVAHKLPFSRPENELKIDYQLFFEETADQHMNIAYFYRADVAADKAGEVFEHGEPAGRVIFDVNSSTFQGTVSGGPAGAPSGTLAAVCKFILLGIRHILSGYDHIAFLVALIVTGLGVREVVKIITAFTVAHSVTLLLAALQVVTLSSRLVEVVIALSICYVAVENLARKEVRNRWLLTFGFGLIHGFGFATILRELLVDGETLLPSVLSFNLGVELGQLGIFLVLLPLLHLLHRFFGAKRVTVCASLLILCIGAAWAVERLFDTTLISL